MNWSLKEKVTIRRALREMRRAALAGEVEVLGADVAKTFADLWGIGLDPTKFVEDREAAELRIPRGRKKRIAIG